MPAAKTTWTIGRLATWSNDLLRSLAGNDVPGVMLAESAPATPVLASDGSVIGTSYGIKVAEVRGPAAKAGLQPGDILLSLDGRPVSEETIAGLLDQKSPDDEVAAVVLRGTEKKTFKIVLAERRD